MFLQEAPADTAAYMIMGFAVILGTIAVYVISLIVRWRAARRDLAMVEEIQRKPAR
jgi:hypothetical protein